MYFPSGKKVSGVVLHCMKVSILGTKYMRQRLICMWGMSYFL